MSDRTQRNVRRVARLIAEADGLLITAGAGMGVDSGLPDFRGRHGFWHGYPALEQRGLTFEQMAQPAWFAADPESAWAFYGHRQQLYRETKPHRGFHALLDWGRAMRGGYFVVTSNVDEQFEAAGCAAERIVAVHGSLFAYQCLAPCRKETWRDEGAPFDIDLESMRTRGPLPRCPFCGGLARPNVLLFDDGAWVSKYRDAQRGRYQHWLAGLKGRRIVVVELGAGMAVPTIRRLGEDLVARGLATLVRINPQASDADEPAIPIKLGALEALMQIEAALPERFRAAARAGVVAPRPVEPWMQHATGSGLDPRPARALEVVEFIDETDRALEPPAWTVAPPTELQATSFIDLDTGHVGPFNAAGLSVADAQACIKLWYGPDREGWLRLPEIQGYVELGYRMMVRGVRQPGSTEAGRPGAAIIALCDGEERLVMSFGVGRRPIDSAYLWRFLHETAPARLMALEFPRVPWIVRRLGPAADKHAAMLPVLGEVGRALAWTCLRLEIGYERGQLK